MNTLLRGPLLWIIPLLLWGLLALLSLSWNLTGLDGMALSLAQERAQSMFKLVQITRLWNARHGGVYVPVTATTPSNPYLRIPDKDVETRDGVKLTMLNPAYMTRQIAEVAKSAGDILFHITSLKPINPGNAPDSWERRSLERFESGTPEVLEYHEENDTRVYRYMGPLITKQACLQCHEAQGYELGDIRGGISVTLPADPILAAQATARSQVVQIHLWAFVLLSATTFFLLAKLRRQWQLLHAAQASLVRSETMSALGGMVAGVAHEINTPIGVAVTSASFLESRTAQLAAALDAESLSRTQFEQYTETCREASAIILSNLQRAERLISSFKRIAADQASEQKSSLDLKTYLESVLLTLRPELKKRNVDVAVDCAADIVLESYAGALSQVITNLIMNSLHHAFAEDRAGNIDIDVTDLGEEVEIVYRDDGIGISEQHLKSIFTPFFTTRRGDGSSGLGLHISHNLVYRVLQGTISVTSREGAGVRFCIRLPKRVG